MRGRYLPMFADVCRCLPMFADVCHTLHFDNLSCSHTYVNYISDEFRTTYTVKSTLLTFRWGVGSSMSRANHSPSNTLRHVQFVEPEGVL
jgi:hypothetical protein